MLYSESCDGMWGGSAEGRNVGQWIGDQGELSAEITYYGEVARSSPPMSLTY